MPSRFNLRQKVFDLIFKAHHNELEQVSTMVQDFLGGRLTREELEEKYCNSQKKTPKLPTLAVGNLDTQKVEEILHLKATQPDNELTHVPFISTSTELKSVLTKVDAAHSKNPLNEASIRWTLDLLLVYAHDIATFSQPDAGQNIGIQTERNWVFEPVTYQKKKFALVGKPDYAVWYGNVDDIAVNIVIMEAKSQNSTSQGVPQCLAYMGMVHRLRRREKKKNCTVYGVTADAQFFFFLKIDEKSRWSTVMVTAAGGKFDHILSMLVYLLRKAREASPTHSKESSAQSHAKEGSGGSLYASEDYKMGNT
ncbi:hypothetical protein N7447_005064 [Penicillium robsamsonii]|uniref:uncharacterized protein n=1 Tax=Penicillium robsamsonii TaxID=1792511 RepID=UPI00254976DB|nr:uncharacterized protein N7447_005064 [Penicillium robsamsonii]KAJ5822724.1 hypothetical protein N7447_005064 [Penicillium robsamsonii]